jgi:Leucine-rich repeat (LRR) protein
VTSDLRRYRLAGYLAYTNAGFALPVFRSQADASRWYIAYADFPKRGDARISQFEALPAEIEAEVKLLPAEAAVSRAVGDLWVDVLMIDGDAVPGEKREIWARIKNSTTETKRNLAMSLANLAEEVGSAAEALEFRAAAEDWKQGGRRRPPPDFDLGRVRDGVLAGEAPPVEWRPWIEELDFALSRLEDLTPLSGLTALRTLNLSETQVVDLTPLSGLTALRTLNLGDTQVVDLSPLSGLTALQRLYLRGTRVVDLTPLSGLTALATLDLGGTRVVDLTALSGLTALQTLELRGTQVVDLTPLSGLTALQELDLRGTQVVDFAPISGLTELQTLALSGTQVVDLTPLSGLTSLEVLDLGESKVVDLTPLSGLTELCVLDLSGTQVVDLTPLPGLTALHTLCLSGTQVVDLAPLSGLKELLHIFVGSAKRKSQLAGSFGGDSDIIKVDTSAAPVISWDRVVSTTRRVGTRLTTSFDKLRARFGFGQTPKAKRPP